MCKTNNHFKHVQCIIPPYISEKLAESANRAIEQKAVKDLSETVKLRAKREFISGLTASQALYFHPADAQKKVIKLNMQVFDMQHGTDPSAAQLIWDNGEAPAAPDEDAQNVIKAGTGTWNLYYEIFGRNSIDNLGLLLRHYIHYSTQYNNAMWDGSEMIYGDGDGNIFGSFTADPDIIGHELTHGVTQNESNLAYHNQSGALNESLSDVFGVMVKQRILNQDVKNADWLIGESVLLGKQYALRSLKAPGTAYVDHPELGTDPQPATMDDFVQLPDTQRGDNGGVHYNSGITNYAFYVAAFNIGGFAWEKTGKIWYDAMTDKSLKSNASFVDFKNLTLEHAAKQFGKGSKEEDAIKAGWAAAKV